VAALLTFVLPVAVAAPPSQIPARLLGWSLAGVFSITACMLVWPRPWHNDLRRLLSAAASALSRLAGAHAAGHRDPDIALAADSALTALRQQFEATPYPPTGATPGASALAKLVGRMEWVGTNAMTADPEAPTLSLARVQTINAAVARTLAASASLICDRQGHPVEDAAIVNAVATERTQLEDLRINSIGAEVVRFIADDDSAEHPAVENEGDMRLLSSIDPAFHARALGLATEMVADATLEASGAWVRNSTEGGGRLAKASDWLYRGRSSLADMLSSHLTLQSVWLRNALRGAIGLALAVAVAESTNVEHGFWVVLGTLSVLRSNALGTGATALRAIAGTVAGFIIGSAILFGLSNHSVLLWAVLPLAVFLAGVAPTMISFATGQAGFTVTVVVLFNIIQPTGWTVGLTRIEDVALGCAVSVVVGLLFWPRGATAELGRALSNAVCLRFDLPRRSDRAPDHPGEQLRYRAEPSRGADHLSAPRRRIPTVRLGTRRQGGPHRDGVGTLHGSGAHSPGCVPAGHPRRVARRGRVLRSSPSTSPGPRCATRATPRATGIGNSVRRCAVAIATLHRLQSTTRPSTPCSSEPSTMPGLPAGSTWCGRCSGCSGPARCSTTSASYRANWPPRPSCSCATGTPPP